MSSNKQSYLNREKNNEFNVLNKDVIKSRQFDYSTNKETHGFESASNVKKVAINNLNLNLDSSNDFFYRSKEKSDEKFERSNKGRNYGQIHNQEMNLNNNNFNELQQQQIELYHNNKREMENLRNDQLALQEKYFKLEKNFFEIEDVL